MREGFEGVTAYYEQAIAEDLKFIQFVIEQVLEKSSCPESIKFNSEDQCCQIFFHKSTILFSNEPKQ